ncbi:hypothetical protein quinque_013832 [Culex quinquefasciatus]
MTISMASRVSFRGEAAFVGWNGADDGTGAGVPMDKCFNLSQDHRDHIARSVMKLVLNELFTFRCIQTDPNWSNFLYEASTRQIMLIDFGATRFYQKPFMDDYMRVIEAATRNDR